MMSRMRPTSRRHHSASTAPSGSTSSRARPALLVGVVAGRRRAAALPLARALRPGCRLAVAAPRRPGRRPGRGMDARRGSPDRRGVGGRRAPRGGVRRSRRRRRSSAAATGRGGPRTSRVLRGARSCRQGLTAGCTPRRRAHAVDARAHRGAASADGDAPGSPPVEPARRAALRAGDPAGARLARRRAGARHHGRRAGVGAAPGRADVRRPARRPRRLARAVRRRPRCPTGFPRCSARCTSSGTTPPARASTSSSASRTFPAAAFAPDDPDLGGRVVVEWAPFDWVEEAHPVIGHPHDPFKRIDLLPSDRHVVVRLGGTVLGRHPHARSPCTRPTSRCAGTSPTTTSSPTSSSAARRPRRAPTRATPSTSRSPRTRSPGSAPRARTSPGPTPTRSHEVAAIKGMVCFYSERTDLELDGVAVPRPVTPWSSPRDQERS